MPIFRCRGQEIYFAHIPKCGGKTVEKYLESRFGDLALLNSRAKFQMTGQEWTRTSPGHILWEDLSLLYPENWFNASFAIVRHPIARAVSAYNFRTSRLVSISPGIDFSTWFSQASKISAKHEFAFDNHLAPQHRFVGQDTTIFKVEDGLDKIIPYVDQIAGDTNDEHTIGWSNKSTTVSAKKRFYHVAPFPEDMAELIYDVYAQDFEQFGYEKTIPEGLKCNVPLAGFKGNPRLKPRTIINAARSYLYKARLKQSQTPIN